MSIKNNTASLQDLLDKVNALPEAENLDAELDTQSTLLSEQDAKIAELAQVLAGKVGGGSTSYDTCTVVINTITSAHQYCFTCFENGEIVYKQQASDSSISSPIAIEKVICNSYFLIAHRIGLYKVQYDNLTVVDASVVGVTCIAPSQAGAVAYITIDNPDTGGAD